MQAYNTSTNSWSWKKQLPIPLSSTNGANVINGKIYVAGGTSDDKNYQSTLFMYDPARNTWTRKRDMPGESYAGVSGVINGQLYVLTSCDQEDCYPFSRGSFYRYNPGTDQWTTLTAPQAYFKHTSGAVLGGKLYAVGSSNGKAQLWVYSPSTNSWTTKAPMNRPREGGAGVAVNSRLYIIGGMSVLEDGTRQAVRTVSRYNPNTNSWTNVQGLPSGRTGLTASRVIVNGLSRIEVLGGDRPNNLQYTP